ncbi:hypothetical protein ACSBR2_013954 [Camellia fascicularis]
MITSYSKLGDVEKAWAVFDRMPLRDVASWSAMIVCYVNNGHWGNGLTLFCEMLVVEQLKPDHNNGRVCPHGFYRIVTWEINSWIYCEEWLGIEYGTWHSFGGHNASWVFDMMQDRNVKSWTVLICGSAQHDYGKEALFMFEMIKEVGVRPVTLVPYPLISDSDFFGDNLGLAEIISAQLPEHIALRLTSRRQLATCWYSENISPQLPPRFYCLGILR